MTIPVDTLIMGGSNATDESEVKDPTGLTTWIGVHDRSPCDVIARMNILGSFVRTPSAGTTMPIAFGT